MRLRPPESDSPRGVCGCIHRRKGGGQPTDNECAEIRDSFRIFFIGNARSVGRLDDFDAFDVFRNGAVRVVGGSVVGVKILLRRGERRTGNSSDNRKTPDFVQNRTEKGKLRAIFQQIVEM